MFYARTYDGGATASSLRGLKHLSELVANGSQIGQGLLDTGDARADHV